MSYTIIYNFTDITGPTDVAYTLQFPMNNITVTLHFFLRGQIIVWLGLKDAHSTCFQFLWQAH